MDPFGVMVLGSVTAIGGGTIRDMALGATPVFGSPTRPTFGSLSSRVSRL
ncbi:putative inner membrane protein [Vibrio maritimus]|uniref:Putative inner membrane protein n=1 Tax=Vibrio maritimus TaxID=990268 RepID=A0A090T922_9VIBR|nr:putative inner membrane protein [Vibrio maritimus]